MSTRRPLLLRPTTAPAAPPARPSTSSSPSSSSSASDHVPPRPLPLAPPRARAAAPNHSGAAAASASIVVNGHLHDHDMDAADASDDDDDDSSDDGASDGDSSSGDGSSSDDSSSDNAGDSRDYYAAHKLHEQWRVTNNTQHARCAKAADQAAADARAAVGAIRLEEFEPYWRAIELEEEEAERADADADAADDDPMEVDPPLHTWHSTPGAPHARLPPSTPLASRSSSSSMRGRTRTRTRTRSRSRAPSIRITSTPLHPSAAASPNASVFDPDMSTIIAVGPGRYVELNDSEEQEGGEGEGDRVWDGLMTLGLSEEERQALTRGVHRMRARLDRVVAQVSRGL